MVKSTGSQCAAHKYVSQLDAWRSKIADPAGRGHSLTTTRAAMVAGSGLINTGSVAPLLPDRVCIFSSTKVPIGGHSDQIRRNSTIMCRHQDDAGTVLISRGL